MNADDQPAANRPVHYVEVDEALCSGCVLCMKACPMKAIRIRDGVARIEGVCIDCMECARVCPEGAIRGVSTADAGPARRSEDVVCPSSVLYSQLGEDFLPNDILLGLRKMGFRYPFDQSYTAEIYEFAIELFIRESDPENKDRAVGIHAIYDELVRSVQEIDEDRVLHYSGGIGLGWGISGGEIAGLRAKSIAVSGVHETIRYLERVEMGLLSHIEFLECRICTEGCVGGPFTVADRYQTKQLVQKYVRMFGGERRIKEKFVKKLYREGWFKAERPVLPIHTENIPLTIAERIEQQKQVESILEMLPKKHCGMCGSPDCRTFAEDVVAGKAQLNHCTRLSERGGTGVIFEG